MTTEIETLREELRDKVMSKADLESALTAKMDEWRETVEKSNEEAKNAGSVAKETRELLEAQAEKMTEITDRLLDMEQNGVKNKSDESETINLGKSFVESDQFKDLQSGRTGRAKIEVKTAIINATGQNQPLVPADRRAGFHTTPNRMLTIRDILPSSPTSSNLIEFVRENTFTNNAGPQVGGSPEAFENVTKPESAITFTLVSQAVTTLAHFIPASKQVLDDSVQLQSFINGRLMYGLKLKEETQLLLGDNANGELNGLHTQATAYTVQSPQLTNEIDIVREMIKQSQVAEYQPDAIIMNPQDWYDVDVRKVGSSDDRYVVGNPQDVTTPRLWGLPIVVTNSLTSGQVMVGAFALGAEIFDRQLASVEVSLEDSTNFQKNMCTIRAEERLSLVVYRTESIIKATI